MHIIVSENAKALGVVAGKKAGALIRAALQEKGFATIILATGTSQFETLIQLTHEPNIDWERVTMFHLDEGPCSFVAASPQRPKLLPRLKRPVRACHEIRQFDFKSIRVRVDHKE
jgi:hypothetical protein